MSLRDLTDELIYSCADGVATLTFNRPDKLNACTTAMYDGISRVAQQVREDDEIKVLVLTGAGKGFCAGSDAKKRLAKRTKGKKSHKEVVEPIGYFSVPLYGLNKPLIAAINGACVGSGLSLALLCDIRISSEKAKFGALWVKRGLIPDVGATWLLPRIIGLDKALAMSFTGEIIDAHEAEQIGLVTEVVPHDMLMHTVNELALNIARGPSVAIELMKRGMSRGFSGDYLSHLEFESYAQNICFQTKDFQESIAAFLEHREPHFQGK